MHSPLTCLSLPFPPPPLISPQSFQTVTEDLKRRFAVNGEPLIDESVVGSLSRGTSPHWSAGEHAWAGQGCCAPFVCLGGG